MIILCFKMMDILKVGIQYQEYKEKRKKDKIL